MAKNFDPKEVSITLGTHIISGYADGTFAAFAQNRDTYALTVGADGEGTRVKSNDRSGRLTVTLLKSSTSNAVLSALANADAQNPCIIKDNNGSTLSSASTAWLVRQADYEYSNEETTVEWIIESDSWDNLVGGISA